MFRLGSKKEQEPEYKQYLMLRPEEEGLAKWEILDREELDRRVAANELLENCRLFPVGEEVKVRFERTTHLE